MGRGKKVQRQEKRMKNFIFVPSLKVDYVRKKLQYLKRDTESKSYAKLYVS